MYYNGWAREIQPFDFLQMFFSLKIFVVPIVYLALNNSTPSWPQAACENAAFFGRPDLRAKGFSEESRKIRISEKPKRWSSCLLKYKKKLKAEKRNKGWWHDVEGLHGTEVWCSCYFYPPVFHILRTSPGCYCDAWEAAFGTLGICRYQSSSSRPRCTMYKHGSKISSKMWSRFQTTTTYILQINLNQLVYLS